MTWHLVAICGFLFIFFIWLAILTIKFSEFKNSTEYKFKIWDKMNQKNFESFKAAVWEQFLSLDKKYKKRKVAKKKEKK